MLWNSFLRLNRWLICWLWEWETALHVQIPTCKWIWHLSSLSFEQMNFYLPDCSVNNIWSSIWTGLFIFDLKRVWWVYRSVILLGPEKRKLKWQSTERRNGQDVTRFFLSETDPSVDIACSQSLNSCYTWSVLDKERDARDTHFCLFCGSHCRMVRIYGNWLYRSGKKVDVPLNLGKWL